MRPFLTYTLARLGLFLVCWLIVGLVASLWLDGSSASVLWTALIALVVSGVAALFVLRPLRDRAAGSVAEGAGRIRSGVEQRRTREDVDD